MRTFDITECYQHCYRTAIDGFMLIDIATTVVRECVAPGAIFRFQYGDYPAEEGLVHSAVYRAFQAWLIAKHLSIPFHLPADIIAGMNSHAVRKVGNG